MLKCKHPPFGGSALHIDMAPLTIATGQGRPTVPSRAKRRIAGETKFELPASTVDGRPGEPW